jgi:hypothetical protein
MTEIYHDVTRQALMQHLEQLQQLQAEGINIGVLDKETWDEIVELIETDDVRSLKIVREQLKEEVEKRKIEPIIGC